MNIRSLCIFIFLLNINLVFGESQQCNSLKKFMEDNNIIPAKDNCCNNDVNFNEPPYISTKCNENNIITELKIQMNFDEIAELNISNFPELPNLQILILNNINLKQSFPEMLKKIKFKNTKENKIVIQNSNIEEISIPQNINMEYLGIINSNLNNVKSIPSNVNNIDFTNNKLTNVDINLFKNVISLSLSNNPLNNNGNSLFRSITEKLTKLEMLLLVNCDIEEIPITINNLSNLKVLDLTENNIEVLPNELNKLEKLEKFLINDNDKNLRGKLNFKQSPKCFLDTTYLCTTNTKNKPCNNLEIQKCKDTELEKINKLLKKHYDNSSDIHNDTIQPSQKKKSSNLPIYIALIIAVILLISFSIFFYKYKYNKQDPLIITDENNATYAYKMSDKSKQIMKEFQLNKEKENKEQNTENTANTRNSNVSLDVNSTEINNNIINTSNSNIQLNHVSQVIENINYENNNLSGNTLFINNNNIPQNITYEFNGASNSENVDLAPPYTATTSLSESKQLIQDANDFMDKEQLRLQAKIQNELLATQESLLEKKIKEDKYNGEEPPPYC